MHVNYDRRDKGVHPGRLASPTTWQCSALEMEVQWIAMYDRNMDSTAHVIFYQRSQPGCEALIPFKVERS